MTEQYFNLENLLENQRNLDNKFKEYKQARGL